VSRFVRCTLIAVLLVIAASPALAQSRTPWQMHDGLEVTAENPDGLIQFSCAPTRHGDPCEYEVATIPAGSDPGWGPAPNGETIGFSIPSRVCRAPVQCMAYGDFTYFQTFVDIPASVEITTFTIDFSGMDDGCRVTIFNSTYPEGLVVPGSYVYLGGSGTTNLKELVVSGEVNRVVITQVDDCCSANNLQSAVVVLNGTAIGTDLPPVCDAGGPYAIESPATQVTLDGTGSSDPDGTAITYLWTSDCPAAVFDDATLARPVLTITPTGEGDVDCTVTLTVGDGQATASCSAPVHIAAASPNRPPDCSLAGVAEPELWPPDHTYHAVSILGVTDPDGDPVTIAVTGITQDEPVNGLGDGDTSPDAEITDGQASLRAERSGTLRNGRVYVVSFTASDGRGGSCDGSVSLCVPHDQGHPTCVDDGQLYVSTGESPGGGMTAAAVSLQVSRVTASTAEIRFGLPEQGPVNLSVYDVVGRRVVTIEDGELASGVHSRVWNMQGLARGMYFVRLRAGATTVTKRVLKADE
jgi:hypothetical protein